MNNKNRILLTFVLALLGGSVLWTTLTQAAPGSAVQVGGAPAVVAYQGEIQVSGSPYSGNGYFKFAVVNATGTTTYWSNNGTSTGGGQPTAAVQLAVSQGLFSLLLGDTTLGGMTQPLTADVFNQPDRYLRIWFSTSGSGPFDQLAPDTMIAAVPYALQAEAAADADLVDGYEGADLEESAEIDGDIVAHSANADAHHTRYTDGEAWTAVLANDGSGSGLDADTVDGLQASELGTHYQNVVVVAQSGADYTSVQAAIDSINDAGVGNPYLVWVAPGVYSETVTMKSHVHLQGAGQEVTVISSAASSGSFPPGATLNLASDTSLRDLTLVNNGTGTNSAALVASNVSNTKVSDVAARAQGAGTTNFALHLSGTDIILERVTALGENGSMDNDGLLVFAGASVALHGGSFTARGGTNSYGIYNYGAVLEAEGVTAVGENGSDINYGLVNTFGGSTTLRGGSFTARGGDDAYGIGNTDSGTTLDAEGVTALGANSLASAGLANTSGASATLYGGSFNGRGSNSLTSGIINSGSGTTLETENVAVLGDIGISANYGLYNISDASATLHGGSFTASGGDYTSGIYSDSTLEAVSVTVLGENGSTSNYGLHNYFPASATLFSGSFTARGGVDTYGIGNFGATLEADGVIALAENSSDTNYGLENDSGLATLHGGSFTARSGTYTYGIRNFNGGAIMEADGVIALAEDGSSNFGLSNAVGAFGTLHGGSFTARGGTVSTGILNADAALEAVEVIALAENGSSTLNGLHNANDASATLQGGSFTARGGSTTSGIRNSGSGALLEADGVTALAENGSGTHFGLDNNQGASATLHGGSFTARGGTITHGIGNYGSGAILEAANITALGEGGSNSDYGLYVTTGSVTINQSVLEGADNAIINVSSVIVSNSRLVGGVVSGTVTCVAVSRNLVFNANGCP